MELFDANIVVILWNLQLTSALRTYDGRQIGSKSTIVNSRQEDQLNKVNWRKSFIFMRL